MTIVLPGTQTLSCSSTTLHFNQSAKTHGYTGGRIIKAQKVETIPDSPRSPVYAACTGVSIDGCKDLNKSQDCYLLVSMRRTLSVFRS
jgi:hypothetical protein